MAGNKQRTQNNKRAKTASINKAQRKVSSLERLQSLLQETENELEQLNPQIEKLEKQVEKLRLLRLEKQKLITLKLSLQSILQNYSDSEVTQEYENVLDPSAQYSIAAMSQAAFPVPSWSSRGTHATHPVPKHRQQQGAFIPEMAFQQVDQVLRRRNSLNYELFRAIVFNGGQASTEQIKQYLLDHQIPQPASGLGFEEVPLTDISSRVNYLVRKGLVNPDGRGNFVSCLGWLVEGLDNQLEASPSHAVLGKAPSA